MEFDINEHIFNGKTNGRTWWGDIKHYLGRLFTGIGAFLGITGVAITAGIKKFWDTVTSDDEEKKKETLKKGSVILGVSMACILQSHILTAEIVCMVLAGVVILYAKRVFCKEVLLAGIKAVAIALVLSTWFLVPFLDYMLRGEFNINSIRNNDILIQRQGVFLSQVFAMFDNAIGQSLDLSAGTQGDFAQGAGLGLMLAIPALLILFFMGYQKKEEKKKTEETAKKQEEKVWLLVNTLLVWDFLT